MKGIVFVCFLMLFCAIVLAQNPCQEGISIVNCFADPCRFGGSHCGELGCHSNFCGGCNAECICEDDSHCREGEFCRPSCTEPISVCVPFKTEEQSCTAKVAKCAEEQCHPDLMCQYLSSNMGWYDVDGICKRNHTTPCEPVTKKCPGSEFCGSKNICLSAGACSTAIDCSSSSWPHLDVPGHAECIFGQCRWQFD